MNKRDHQRLLEAFWIQSSTATSQQERMSLLKRLAALPIVPPNQREVRAGLTLPAQSICWSCRAENHLRMEWHHIIPVKCGGITQRFNFVAICETCHREAHSEALTCWVIPKPKAERGWKIWKKRPKSAPAPEKWTPRPIPWNRIHGYPMVCLADMDPNRDFNEQYEEMADAYHWECEEREDRRARAQMDTICAFKEQQEKEFAEGNFESVEDDLERERLEARWAEREEEREEERAYEREELRRFEEECVEERRKAVEEGREPESWARLRKALPTDIEYDPANPDKLF